MKVSKISILAIGASLMALQGSQSLRADVTIAHPEPDSTAGQFLGVTGIAITAGALTIGYFSGTAPTSPQWTAFSLMPATAAYSALINPSGTFKFVDVRNIAGATQAGGFDWSFPGIGGTVQTIPVSTLVPNTQLFIMAFNGGTLANGFTGTTQWAVVAADDWISPADTVVKSLLLSSVDTASEIKIGTDNVNNVNLVASIPEPTSLMLIGGALLVFFRFAGVRRVRFHNSKHVGC